MTDHAPQKKTHFAERTPYFAPLRFLALDAARPEMNAMAAVAALMAVWWMTEALPLAATALVPLALFPLWSIMPARDVAQKYGDPNIYLYLGGFFIALAVEESGLHRRIALSIVAAMGDNPRRLVLGFMLAGYALSMWMSNTATTLMLLPIAASVLAQLDGQPLDGQSLDGALRRRFGTALMLSLAYAATIGGMATLIGTPTNLVFRSFYADTYRDSPPVSFVGWMALAVPLSLVFLMFAWWLLVRVALPLANQPLLGGRDAVRDLLRKLGPMQSAEWRMLAIFLATALLWVFREPIKGWGWAPGLGLGLVDDGTVAVALALVCFLVPSGRRDGRPLLTWQAASRVPWGILLLFGGGLALGEGMRATGLDRFAGQQMRVALGPLAEWARAAVICASVTLLSELTSNVACITMVLPILQGAAAELGVDPAQLMLPAALAASCGFMLPVATPPNTIVYGAGRIPLRDMLRAGLWMNLVGVTLITIFTLLGGSVVFLGGSR